MNLTAFCYGSQEIRTAIIDGEPWFVAKDICQVLGLGNTSQALARLDKDEVMPLPYDVVITLNDDPYTARLSAISESGMYSLVLRSRKPEAQPFRKWVTSEVLPSIRKTGGYSLAPAHQLPANYIDALKALVASEESKAIALAEKALLEEQNHQLSEAVDELFDYSSIIRIAKFNGVSENLFKWQTLKAVSKKMGHEIKRVPCPRFEYKNIYSHDAWRVCYPNVRLPETMTIIVKGCGDA